jgi:HemY protein
MRVALWLFALFAIAAASALFAGSNPGTLTLFWSPYRVDVSLNLALLCLLIIFVAAHLGLRAVGAMFDIPRQARRWRLQQKERAIAAALLDSLSHLIGGRFIRARKAAELVVSLEGSMSRNGETLPHSDQLRVLAHMLAAESAHALQDRALRDAHLQLALEEATSRDALETRDGVQLRGARWAFDDRDPGKSLEWLDQLSGGAARRTIALRLRFKAARLSRKPAQALEYARILTKHRAFSELAGRSIARGLALEWIDTAHDTAQVLEVWRSLDQAERNIPDVAMHAADRFLLMGGDAAVSRQWLLPVWESMLRQSESLGTPQRVRLVRILERGFGETGNPPEAAWLSRVEAAQMANPRDPVLQYLAGVVCMRLSLWGKAQQMLKQSLTLLTDPRLRRDAWHALAILAEQRQDSDASAQAYREAVRESSKT